MHSPAPVATERRPLPARGMWMRPAPAPQAYLDRARSAPPVAPAAPHSKARPAAAPAHPPAADRPLPKPGQAVARKVAVRNLIAGPGPAVRCTGRCATLLAAFAAQTTLPAPAG